MALHGLAFLFLALYVSLVGHLSVRSSHACPLGVGCMCIRSTTKSVLLVHVVSAICACVHLIACVVHAYCLCVNACLLYVHVQLEHLFLHLGVEFASL